MAHTSTLDPRGSLSLAGGTRLLDGFTPAATTARQDDHLHLACCLEGSWTPVAGCVRQDRDDRPVAIRTEVGTRKHDPETVQVRRLLSLDTTTRSRCAGSGGRGVRDAAALRDRPCARPTDGPTPPVTQHQASRVVSAVVRRCRVRTDRGARASSAMTP